MTEPSWLAEARKHIGVKEVPGKGNSPVIARWLRELKAWWSDDAVPWCGVFIAYVMQKNEIQIPKHWYRALAWSDWGVQLRRPALGAVVVFGRAGGGHVGLVVGTDPAGRLLVLGGNQSDAVNIRAFDPERVVAFRWPSNHVADWPHLIDADLPLVASGAPRSLTEA